MDQLNIIALGEKMNAFSRRTLITFSLFVGVILTWSYSSVKAQIRDSDFDVEGIAINYGLAFEHGYREFVGLTFEQDIIGSELNAKYGTIIFELQMKLGEIDKQKQSGQIGNQERELLRTAVFENMGRASRERNIEFAKALRPDQVTLVKELSVGLYLQKLFEGRPNKDLAILTDNVTSKLLGLSFEQDRKVRELAEKLKDSERDINEKVEGKVSATWKDLERELLKTLTDEQRNKYFEFIGPDFEFKDSEFTDTIRRLSGLVVISTDRFGLIESEPESFLKARSAATVRHMPGMPLALVFPVKSLPRELNSIILVLGLLQNESVAEEIDLLPNQKDLVEKVAMNYDEFKTMNVKIVIVNTPSGTYQTSGGKLETGWVIPNAEFLKDESGDLERLRSELIQSQWNRLEQLQLRWALEVSKVKIKLLHPDWQEILTLSDEQKSEWKKTIEEFRESFKAIIAEHEPDREMIRSKTYRDIQQILEPEQLEKFNRLLGKRTT